MRERCCPACQGIRVSAVDINPVKGDKGYVRYRMKWGDVLLTTAYVEDPDQVKETVDGQIL